MPGSMLSMCVFGAAVLSAGCASTGAGEVLAEGEASVTGAIVSIDTTPWMYDGNAVVLVESAGKKRVAVQLPARWNLCKAAAVDVESLRVGMQVQVLGGAGEEGEIVVCQGANHRLVPVD